MICKVCGIDKIDSEFRKQRKTCKVCEKEYNKKWCANNKDKVRVHSKNSRKKRIEKDKVLKHDWYIKNKEKLLVKNSEYMKGLPKDIRSKYQNTYYNKNKKNINDRQKNDRKKNPEKFAKRAHKYVDELADCYVKRNLANKGFDRELITDDIIETQRLIIKTKRLCKTLQN